MLRGLLNGIERRGGKTVFHYPNLSWREPGMRQPVTNPLYANTCARSAVETLMALHEEMDMLRDEYLPSLNVGAGQSGKQGRRRQVDKYKRLDWRAYRAKMLALDTLARSIESDLARNGGEDAPACFSPRDHRTMHEIRAHEGMHGFWRSILPEYASDPEAARTKVGHITSLLLLDLGAPGVKLLNAYYDYADLATAEEMLTAIVGMAAELRRVQYAGPHPNQGRIYMDIARAFRSYVEAWKGEAGAPSAATLRADLLAAAQVFNQKYPSTGALLRALKQYAKVVT